MVALEQMRSSNARIAECLPAGLVAVFVGGTSGIGESTMKQFVQHTVQPRICFIGRSERAAARITTDLTALNPAGQYCFIRADLSLLRNVDDVCREIKAREPLINLLFLTTGTVVTNKETPESLYYPTAVTYYARIRLIVNLLPLLQKATSLRRVVTVYGGTKEGPVCIGDLQGRSLPSSFTPTSPTTVTPTRYGRVPLQGHTSTMTTLALESLALEAPDVSFVHSFPGSVRTKLGREAKGIGLVKVVLNRVVGPAVPAVPLGEAGERQLFFATSGRFPARGGVDVGATAGVPVQVQGQKGDGEGVGVGVARGSDARVGSGVYSVDYDGEAQNGKVGEVLQRLREEDLVRRLWLHTVGEFLRVTGTEFV